MKTSIKLRELKLKKLRFKRRQYRIGLIFLGIVATIILAFNFWFIDHAEEAIEDIVATQSKGKLKLKVANFKFNWIKNRIVLDEATITSTDSTAPVIYAINTKRISIKARGFLPLLFKKQVLIDSIRLTAPTVIFTRLEEKIKKTDAYKDSVKDAKSGKDFSVAEEMGRLSKSINDVISVLQINSFKLDNGSFSLIDKTKPNESPFVVNKVYIQLDNLQFDSTKTKHKKNKIEFTDNIAIRTSDQNIIFPGGRHLLSFKNFRVNIRNKRVEFDSCTFRAVKGDSSKSSFRIFFDKLQLTKINFDTLYTTETIIADSVYCSNPKIFLDVDADQKTVKKEKKEIEKIDDLIEQLLGDMKLNYVGVKNADVDLSTIKNNKASTISARNTNFEIYDLMVKQGQKRPVSASKLLMTLHNYETTLQDGRYMIAFDSVRFEDDYISLNKFSFKEFKGGRAIKSISMPTFRVGGLSWDSLLYNNTFSAYNASFYSPVVDYTATSNKRTAKKPKNIFETLNNIDDVMDLKNLDIHQGDITLRFGKGASLYLQNANLALLAKDFTSSNRVKSVQRAVKELNFNKGVFKKGDITALLDNVRLSDNKSGIKATRMNLTSKNMRANANNINIGTILLDSADQSIVVEGIQWDNAKILMSGSNPNKKAKSNGGKNGKTSIVLKNIYGTNTGLNLALNNRKITGDFNIISIEQFVQNAGGKPQINGLSLDGRRLLMRGPDMRLSLGKMDISDNNNSVIKNIEFSKINRFDSIVAFIPQLTIVPNITEIVGGNLRFNGLILADPFINARIGKKDSLQQKQKKKATEISIASALLQRPEVRLTLINKNDSASYITWNGLKQNSYLQLTNFESTPKIPIKADQIKVYLTNFEFINTQGKKTATNDNKLMLEFNNPLVTKNENEKADWRTDVSILSIDKLTFDSLGKNNALLKLDKGDVRNITLNSKYIKNIGAVITNSDRLKINGANGSFTTGKNNLFWYNFNVNNKVFTVDSFSFAPKQTPEDYRVAKAFNEDYLKVKSGKIIGGPFDLDKFVDDSIINVGNIEMNDVDLFTFKDKTQPDTATKYKPLPAELLARMSNSIRIDSLMLKNMNVTYWEINPKTDTLGIIPISNLNAIISNIKNYDISDKDSIYIVATANVLNALQTHLKVTQSYTDTLGYLTMKLNTGPMNLTDFNTVLVPLVGVEILRGNLSKVQMETIGNNNASVGTMRMYYKGLKLRLLNKKNLPHQTFINKVVSWAAMALIVRKNNRGKESLVFFERLQDKSAINYIIKTTIEGLKSSVGVPGVKGKYRKYKRRMAKAAK